MLPGQATMVVLVVYSSLDNVKLVIMQARLVSVPMFYSLTGIKVRGYAH